MSYLTPGVGFEEGLALGATIAIRIVAVVILVLGTDEGVARLGCRLRRRLGCGRRGVGDRRIRLSSAYLLAMQSCSTLSIVARKRAADPIGSAALGVRLKRQIVRHAPKTYCASGTS